MADSKGMAKKLLSKALLVLDKPKIFSLCSSLEGPAIMSFFGNIIEIGTRIGKIDPLEELSF